MGKIVAKRNVFIGVVIVTIVLLVIELAIVMVKMESVEAMIRNA